MRPTLYQEIAGDIKSRIQADSSWSPGSVAELQARYGVSYQTMLKSVHLLSDQGLLECRRGRKIRLVREAQGKHPAEHPEGATSAGRLYGIIKEGILDGFYKIGTALPKISYFTITHHVSSSTVSEALHRLEQEDLIYQQGKRRIAGARPVRDVVDAKQMILSSADHSVVLVLTPREQDWNNLFTVSFLAPFGEAFRSEIAKYRFTVRLAVMDKAFFSPPHLSSASTDTLKRYVEALGSRYRGSLVLYNETNQNMVEQCIQMLVRMDAPVVYFDHTGRGKNGIDPKERWSRNFYQFHLDETGAVNLVARALVDLGHRTIAFPRPAHLQKPNLWIDHRIGLFNQALRSADKTATAITTYCKEQFWPHFSFNWPNYDEFVKSISSHICEQIGIKQLPPAGSAEFRKLLFRVTPSLALVLSSEKVSALVAVDDHYARAFLFWLNAAGIEVPGKISLVSFNDVPSSIAFPISTVDFGFSRLGYLAAHALIGDIEVKTDRDRNVSGKVHLVDRGSLHDLNRNGVREFRSDLSTLCQ